jgi:DNA-binding response OmpR family regulator
LFTSAVSAQATDNKGRGGLFSPDPSDHEQRSASVGRSVLVVDDEHRIADSIAQILGMSGYRSSASYCGMDAVEEAIQQCPDILIVDVFMPDLSGIEVAKRVHEACPETRILLLSGNANISDLLGETEGQGYAFELLAKPIHPSDLLAKLRA